MNSIMTKALAPVAEIIAEVAVKQFDELLESQEAAAAAFEKEWGLQVDSQPMQDPEKQENTRKLIRGHTVRSAGKVERKQAKIRLEEVVVGVVAKLKPGEVPDKPLVTDDTE